MVRRKREEIRNSDMMGTVVDPGGGFPQRRSMRPRSIEHKWGRPVRTQKHRKLKVRGFLTQVRHKSDFREIFTEAET